MFTKILRSRRCLALPCSLVLSLSSLAVHAQLTQIADATGLNASDVITPDYPGSIGDNIAAPFSMNAGGNAITFTALNGATVVHSSPDSTDFPVGTSVIITQDSSGNADGPLRLEFASGLREFGLYSQNDAYDFETFTFSAFHNATLLGRFTTPLIDNTSVAGVALFLGAKVTGNDTITSVTISSMSDQAGTANNFFIGPVTFSPAAVPEPGSIALLMGMAFVGSGLHRRRRSRQPSLV